VDEAVPVLHVANFADRVGGGEESLLTLAQHLDRRRFAIRVLLPGTGTLAEALRLLTVQTAVLPVPAIRPWTLPVVVWTVRCIRRVLAEDRVCLVHAHGSRSALYAGLAARLAGVPLIWHARVAERDPILDGVLLSLATSVIAISEAVKRRFNTSRHGIKVRVIYNGVDSASWTPFSEPAAPSAAPVVLLPGRFGREKGQDVLILAVPTVLRQHPAARFVLLGRDDGREADRCRLLADRLGVAHALDIREWVADPRPVFREAAIVALPSRSEGFGRVLVEAALLGKPVVASRVGGIPEVVLDDTTGLLVPPADPTALADALIALLADRDRRVRLGEAARARALRLFTAEAHADAVAALYADLLAKGRAQP
jgi:glycosyltransferase involved in cell wall biosynthesis